MKKPINGDKEPIITADYKFDGTRIGDYTGSFIEHMYLSSFRIAPQFINSVMPICVREKKDGKVREDR